MDYSKKINDRQLINGKDDVIQLYPIKYKFAWQYYLAANSNHWLPQEVNMQKDIAQWKAKGVLTDNEKHVIETALGFFTTADSLVANNLVLGVYSRTTSPECRMYLLRQAYEEAIHTHSYQHIVETLGLDEEKIFNKYQQVEAIYNKDNFVTNLSYNLKNTHLKFSDSNFLEALIDFYIIMEGIFFYTSFAAIFSFSRRNLLPGTVEQFQYILRDESLHLNFGIEFINQLIIENPELWTIDFKGHILGKLKKASELECQYAKEMIGEGILGLSSDLFIQYAQCITDRRAQSIKLPIIFGVKNPFPWLSETIDLQKQKNFFETTVTDYSTGTLEW